MKITILCSDSRHPVMPHIRQWVHERLDQHDIRLVEKKRDATGGDILFLVSCSEIVTSETRKNYAATLVLHASDLPKGRGWSPHIRELSAGATAITLSLLEAEDRVDSGRIWKKTRIPIPRDALWNEINDLLFTAEIAMMDFAIEALPTIVPTAQSDAEQATYYPKRSPENSEIDPGKSIADQFDLIRVCDPNRFPAWFRFRGHRYLLKLEKADD